MHYISGIECVERLEYNPGFCISLEQNLADAAYNQTAEPNSELYVYHHTSATACELLCVKLHSDFCNGMFYNR